MAGSDGSDDDLLLALIGVELAGAAVHDVVVATGSLDATTAAVVASFAEHHRAHAAAYADALAGDRATEPEADPDASQALLSLVFGAVDAAALLRGALAVEARMAATGVDACARAAGRQVAALAARVAAVEARHQAILTTAAGSATELATSPEDSLLRG